MIIRYENSDVAWSGFEQYVKDTISKFNVKSVLEIGGGANPLLSLEYIKQLGLEYTVLDISAQELAKAPDGYLKVQADITSPNLKLTAQYDLAISQMLAEHVKSGKVFHENIFQLLKNQGVAVHFFPTLYAPPFVFNKLLPDKLSEGLLHLLQKGRESHGKTAKFTAYYSWCYGPTKKQINAFQSLGYFVSGFIGFFGHDGYYQRLGPLLKIHQVITAWLIKHPIPQLTSYAYIVLQKK